MAKFLRDYVLAPIIAMILAVGFLWLIYSAASLAR